MKISHPLYTCVCFELTIFACFSFRFCFFSVLYILQKMVKRKEQNKKDRRKKCVGPKTIPPFNSRVSIMITFYDVKLYSLFRALKIGQHNNTHTHTYTTTHCSSRLNVLYNITIITWMRSLLIIIIIVSSSFNIASLLTTVI